MAELDTARIKRNIGKMIDGGASEAEIDEYVAAEGATADMLRGVKPSGKTVLGEISQFPAALSKGASGVASGVGKTLKHFTGADQTAQAFETAASKIDPGKGYKSASQEFFRPGEEGFGWSSAPRAVVESVPGLGIDVLAATAAKKLAGKGALGTAAAAAGGIASYLMRSAGDETEQRAKTRTGSADAQPTTEDKAYGAGSATVQALLNQLGVSRFVNPASITATGLKGAAQAATNFAKKVGVEGVTEAGQDVVSQVGQTINTPGGVRVDPKQALGSGILGAGAGGVLGGVRAASDANNARRFKDFDHEASAALANRIQSHADGKSLAKVKVARAAVGAAETDIESDLKSALDADPAAKQSIAEHDTARRTLARLNAGEAVSDADLNSLSEATRGAAASERISALTREMSALRKLKKMGTYSERGFKGGISNQMERGVRVISNPAGALTAGAAGLVAGMQGAMSMGIMSSAPHILALSGGAYAGARALDRATGYRSPADTFVKKFGDDGRTTTPPITQEEPPQSTGSVPQVPPVDAMPWGAPSWFTPAQQAAVDKRNTRERQREMVRDFDSFLAEQKDAAKARANQQRQEDFVERTVRAQVAGEQRVKALQERAEQMALREQMRDARELTAARRANEARAEKPSDPFEAIRHLMGQLQAYEKVKKRSATAGKPQPRSPDTVDTQSRPEASKAEAERSTTDLPEDPFWHLDHPEAAQRSLEQAKAAGAKIDNDKRYMVGIVKKRSEIEGALTDLSKKLPSVEARLMVQPFFSHFFATRRRADARAVREALKERIPEHARLVDEALPDEKINTIWKK